MPHTFFIVCEKNRGTTSSTSVSSSRFDAELHFFLGSSSSLFETTGRSAWWEIYAKEKETDGNSSCVVRRNRTLNSIVRWTIKLAKVTRDWSLNRQFTGFSLVFPPTAHLLFPSFFPLSFSKENEKEDRVEKTGNWTKHRLKSFPEQVVTGRVRRTQRTTFSKWKVIGLRNSSICLGVIDGERRKERDRGWIEQESWIEIYSESLPPRRSLLSSKNRNGSKYVTLDSRSSSRPREGRLELHFFFYAGSLPSFSTKNARVPPVYSVLKIESPWRRVSWEVHFSRSCLPRRVFSPQCNRGQRKNIIAQ